MHTPDKDAIALLPPFERLGLDRITLVRTLPDALEASAELADTPHWGFDTESKPTFRVGEVSDGPTFFSCPLPSGPGYFNCMNQVAVLRLRHYWR